MYCIAGNFLWWKCIGGIFAIKNIFHDYPLVSLKDSRKQLLEEQVLQKQGRGEEKKYYKNKNKEKGQGLLKQEEGGGHDLLQVQGELLKQQEL